MSEDTRTVGSGVAPDPADDPDGDVWRGAAAFRGVVRGGVIVFDNPRVVRADGTEVQVKIRPHEFTPDERAEFEVWDRLGNEAWGLIEQWEREQGCTWAEVLAWSPEGAAGNSPGREPRVP